MFGLFRKKEAGKECCDETKEQKITTAEKEKKPEGCCGGHAHTASEKMTSKNGTCH